MLWVPLFSTSIVKKGSRSCNPTHEKHILKYSAISHVNTQTSRQLPTNRIIKMQANSSEAEFILI